jgi:hypothetical protein
MSSMEIWESSLANHAEGTRVKYRKYFREFSKHVNATPDKLREMKYEEDQAKPWERNRVENLLRGYIRSLEEKNYPVILNI